MRNILISAGMIQGGRSGVARYVFELVKNLSDKERLTVAGFASDRHQFQKSNIEWVNIPAFCSHPIFNILWHQLILPLIILCKSIDIVHIPSYRRMLFFCPTKQVVTIHDCAAFIMPEKYDYFRKFYATQLIPYLARRVDHIITVSEFSRDNIIKFMHVDEGKVTVAYNGINMMKFRPTIQSNHGKAGWFEKPYFLYVARLEHPAKNHVRLIEAFETFMKATNGDYNLILAGSDWHGAEVIHERIDRSSYSHAVKVTGFVDDELLPVLYSNAEALLFPSLSEGFGFPVLEAMLCGTLVCCSNRDSLPEVSGGHAFLFDPEVINSIGWTMQIVDSMRQEPALLEERVINGMNWAKEFTWEKHSRMVLEVYNEITTQCLKAIKSSSSSSLSIH